MPFYDDLFLSGSTYTFILFVGIPIFYRALWGICLSGPGLLDYGRFPFFSFVGIYVVLVCTFFYFSWGC